jgi:hypothetical protein
LIVLTVLISGLLVTVKNLLAELNVLADMTVYIDVHIRDLLLHDVQMEHKACISSVATAFVD